MTEPETKQPESASNNQGVQLGIGTLIIIALIVTMCSGRSEVEKVQKDTAELRKQLVAIDQKLDTLVSKSAATSAVPVDAPENAVAAPPRSQ